VLGPTEGGLGGLNAPDGFHASGRNAYPSRANAFFANVQETIRGEKIKGHDVVASFKKPQK